MGKIEKLYKRLDEEFESLKSTIREIVEQSEFNATGKAKKEGDEKIEELEESIDELTAKNSELEDFLEVAFDCENLREENIAKGLINIFEYMKKGKLEYEKIETLINKINKYVER